MRFRISCRLAGIALAVASAAGVTIAQHAAPPVTWPGSLGGGETLLPNGWRIAPAGRHMSIGDLPLNMVLSPDGRYLIVSNNGYSKPTLRIVDLERGVVASSVALDDAWLGLAWNKDGTKLYSSGAAANSVIELSWRNGRLARTGTLPLGRSARETIEGGGRRETVPQSFVGGISVSPDGARLAAAHVLGEVVSLVDLSTGNVRTTVDVPAEPYTTLFSRDGSTLFVSLWGGARILLLDPKTLASKGEIAVGEHPNAMVQAADGRLFVACANTNAVWVVDPAAMKATEQISVALFPEAPPGSTPNALALSPDGQRLLVANADNNTVAVVDVSKAGASRVVGFIPTGWYPTGVAFSLRGEAIYILSGKGLTSQPNPRGPQAGVPGAEGQYTDVILQGALSILPMPDDETLRRYTNTVYRVTPYNDSTRLTPASAPADNAIPRRVGDSSPIKHVFYVIRENRTYDQILGDLDRGNGDPTLALFGDNVTPNAHALAKEFVTLDNFYVDAEVSYDGHAFSTGAIANDFVEKIWPTNYGSRGAAYLSEGGGKMRNAYGNVTAPQNGYIWDACIRAGKAVRSYGEFADGDAAAGRMEASVPGLKGRVAPSYPGWDLKITDAHRIDAWLEEFRKFEADGTLPALSILRLPNDHTSGLSAGSPTPRAMIAENDQALGRLVDVVSHSRYWNDSAIFVLEDDAQNGPDHVDAHRSVALIASPYVKRGAVDSTLYTTSGMLRTMELILGLPPMSQYDASAHPMYNAFTNTTALAPFTRRDARVRLDEMNTGTGPDARASAAMDFTHEDLAPEIELNEILWRSVHGPAAVMPPPRHAAFIRPLAAGEIGDGDDDDLPVRPAPPIKR
ncbi:MAG: alkaline phosphatase family protein [Vicinamibacterales bacterium]